MQSIIANAITIFFLMDFIGTIAGARLLALSGAISKHLNEEVIRRIEKITSILLSVIAAKMTMGGIRE